MNILAQVSFVGSWVVMFVEACPFFTHMIVKTRQRLNPLDVGCLLASYGHVGRQHALQGHVSSSSATPYLTYIGNPQCVVFNIKTLCPTARVQVSTVVQDMVEVHAPQAVARRRSELVKAAATKKLLDVVSAVPDLAMYKVRVHTR